MAYFLYFLTKNFSRYYFYLVSYYYTSVYYFPHKQGFIFSNSSFRILYFIRILTCYFSFTHFNVELFLIVKRWCLQISSVKACSYQLHQYFVTACKTKFTCENIHRLFCICKHGGFPLLWKYSLNHLLSQRNIRSRHLVLTC